MKKFAVALVLMAACGRSTHGAPYTSPACSCPSAQPPASTPLEASPTVRTEVHFSPMGGCTDAVVALLASSKKTVRMMAYGFTSVPVSDALIAARRRGVDVLVILDKSNLTEFASKLPSVVAGGVTAFIDSKHAIMHDKDIVVDGEVLETGSFNFTTAAENRNAENCLVIHSRALAGQYEANWSIHQAHSAKAPRVAGAVVGSP